jgi:hypothetical protein
MRVVGKGCWFECLVRGWREGEQGWKGVGRGLEVQLEVGLKGGGGGWGGGVWKGATGSWLG